jgi:TolA-binding protein
MCPNRVEELESRVQELQASVEGLTDELVECKVRLRELENAVDEDLGFAPVSEDLDGFEDPVAEATEAAAEAAAAAESPDSADTPNNEAPDGEHNAEESESESGDIIVA